MCFVAACMSSLEKRLLRSSFHCLVFLISSWMKSLFILEINPLLVSSYTNMFSHSVGCVFILFMVSFAVQKLLIRCHLFILVFIFTAPGSGSKNTHCFNLCQREFYLFSTKSFIISSLTFRSLIHFQFIFIYDFRECSNFILEQIAVQFSWCHLLKRLSFLHCVFLPP